MELTFDKIHELNYESALARTMILEIFKHYPDIKVHIMEDVDVITEKFARQLFHMLKDQEKNKKLSS